MVDIERVVFCGPPLPEDRTPEQIALVRKVNDHLLAWQDHLRDLIRKYPGGAEAVAALTNLDEDEVRNLILRPEDAPLVDFFSVLTILSEVPRARTTVLRMAETRYPEFVWSYKYHAFDTYHPHTLSTTYNGHDVEIGYMIPDSDTNLFYVRARKIGRDNWFVLVLDEYLPGLDNVIDRLRLLTDA